MDAKDLPVREIDGERFDDFEGFTREFSEHVLGGDRWHGNLDAFNDILRGGFGSPDGGFLLRWRHSERSRRQLGHAAMARWLEGILGTCHPSNRIRVRQRLSAARWGDGQTLFDLIVEIIQVHGDGGREAEDGVVLELC